MFIVHFSFHKFEQGGVCGNKLPYPFIAKTLSVFPRTILEDSEEEMKLLRLFFIGICLVSAVNCTRFLVILKDKFRFPLLIFWFFDFVFVVVAKTLYKSSGAVKQLEANPDAKRLYDDLLSNYNRLIRPVINNTETLTVWLGLKLSQLIEVNLKNQVMTTNLWVPQVICFIKKSLIERN